MGTMDQALLHLVDRRGQTLPGSIRLAVVGLIEYN
jgi:hypothetical protein